MKIQLKTLAAALCASGLVFTQAFAAATDDGQVKNELAKLRKEVSSLKSQLKAHQKRTEHRFGPNVRYITLPERKSGITKPIIPAHYPHGDEPPPTNEPERPPYTVYPTSSTSEKTAVNAPRETKTRYPVHASLTREEQENTPPSPLTGQDIVRLIGEQREFLPFDLDVPGQAFVSTGPYVGVPIQYAGSNLIINSPSVNTDVQLLNIRKKIHQQLVAMGGLLFSEPYHSHLLLSGVVEGQAGYLRPSSGASASDIDVTNVSLDAFWLGPSDWLLGFIEFTYDNSSPINSIYTSVNNYRVLNSRVFVNKAFVTIGDFEKTPFYGSFGQFYVPYGTYSSQMVTAPLTRSLARTKGRAVLIGFQEQCDNALYGSAFVFTGDTHTGSIPKIGNGGINFGLRFVKGEISGDIGVSVIANLADSGGLQLGNNFSQFERIVHRVPGYNVRALFSIGDHIDLIGEYVGASTRFNPNDMSFNNHGAKPLAINLEAAYSFKVCDRPSSIGIGYGKTNEALAVTLPKRRYSIVGNTSLWRNTLQSLEFRRELNYPRGNTATAANNTVVVPQYGRFANAVTAQFDYYF